MSWYKISQNKISLQNLIITEECTGYHHGQTDCNLRAIYDDKSVGILSFTIFDYKIFIQFISVSPKYRRIGIATAMYRKLEEISKRDNMEIEKGYSTDDGTKWINSL